MAKLIGKGMKISGIVCAIPDNHTNVFDLGGPYFEKEFIETMNKTVGVDNIYVCKPGQSSGDLGYAAADVLLDKMEWDRDSVDALLFISQTLDYVIPPTSAKLQHMLGLSNNTFVIDANYGCAGFVCSLMLANQMIMSGMAEKIVVINAESHRHFISDMDREGALLFSDGASAVAIEKDDEWSDSFFMSLVDGEHYSDITLGLYKQADHLNPYGKEYSYMNGENVTQFMLRNIPKLSKSILEFAGVDKNDLDSFLFHQANAHMVKYVSKRMKLDLDKVLINIENFANISSVSIPLLICDKKKQLFSNNSEQVMILGFGAGFLLAGGVLRLGEMKGGDILFV